MFKVGDKVRCIKGVFGKGGPELGRTYTVISVKPNAYDGGGCWLGVYVPNYETDDPDRALGKTPTFGSRCFELVKPFRQLPEWF